MMTDPEYAALGSLVAAIPVGHFGKPVYEVGAGVGGSAKVISQALIDSGNPAKLQSVDNYTMNMGRVRDLTGQNFKTQMEAVGFAIRNRNNVVCIKGESLNVASLVADDSIAFVLVDGDHRYEAAYDDMTAWGHKVAPGGLMVMHDIGKDVMTWRYGPTKAYARWMVPRPDWRVIMQTEAIMGVQRLV